MDYSGEPPSGQQKVIISASLVAKIAQHCATSHMLRGWHAHFDDSISQIDRAAAVKGYDLIVEGAINARQIARELGVTLLDVSNLTWELSPRPARPAAEF